MNGHAPATLASRQRYVGLRHAGAFDVAAWLRAHPAARRLIPARLFDYLPLARRLCAFFADLEAVLIQAWRVLRPGGHALSSSRIM